MKRISYRTCIGCLAKQSKEKFIRLVMENNQVVLDPNGSTQGRGAYLCKTSKGIKEACLKKAIKRDAFRRAFQQGVKIDSLIN